MLYGIKITRSAQEGTSIGDLTMLNLSAKIMRSHEYEHRKITIRRLNQ